MCDPFSGMTNFSLRGIERVPRGCRGVYSFWYKKNCVYVGKAEDQDITNRLFQHWTHSHSSALRAWISAKRVALKIAYRCYDDKNTISQMEKLFIRRFKPLANRVKYTKYDLQGRIQ